MTTHKQQLYAALAQRYPPDLVRQHLERMDASYFATFGVEEVERHVAMVSRLDGRNLVEVDAQPLNAEGTWGVTLVGYDYMGELSTICGLLAAFGFSIVDGHIFTYEPLPQEGKDTGTQRYKDARGRGGGRRRRRRALPPSDRSSLSVARKIVDVFTVRKVEGEVTPQLWQDYELELEGLLQLLREGNLREVRGRLVKRVADFLRGSEFAGTPLYPVAVALDNDASERYTVLTIDSLDTVGFLYEFTNALAMCGVYIARVEVGTTDNRVHDVLFVTDARGRKISDDAKQREIRVATVLIKHFTHLLPLSPNPEAALVHFSDFLAQTLARPNWTEEFSAVERREVMEALAHLLGVSDFLWEDFLRMQHENLFPIVSDVEGLRQAKTKEQMRQELSAALTPPSPPCEEGEKGGAGAAQDFDAQKTALNAYKDREMFRIDMRHILGHTGGFEQFSAELTDLVEVVIEAACRLCEARLRAQWGAPMLPSGQPCRWVVCALGKCGGRELGYASDIELMFVYAGSGVTSAPHGITNAEFYEKFVGAVQSYIVAKREGIFEIDLRLRPFGSAGTLATSLESFAQYFGEGGAAWAYERQALVKLRPIAGDEGVGQRVVELRDAIVYGGKPFDVAAMRDMRERQLKHLVKAGTVNAKHSAGGLVDVEYFVQALQMRHGHDDPALRATTTLRAMERLAETRHLSTRDHAQLRDAYVFLRRLIDALRVVRGNAKDLTVPPTDSEEFAFLARRLGYATREVLQRDIETRMKAVRRLTQKL